MGKQIMPLSFYLRDHPPVLRTRPFGASPTGVSPEKLLPVVLLPESFKTQVNPVSFPFGSLCRVSPTVGMDISMSYHICQALGTSLAGMNNAPIGGRRYTQEINISANAASQLNKTSKPQLLRFLFCWYSCLSAPPPCFVIFV